jgi:hypothetical protein
MTADLALLLVICIAGWLRVKWERLQDERSKREKYLNGDYA